MRRHLTRRDGRRASQPATRKTPRRKGASHSYGLSRANGNRRWHLLLDAWALTATTRALDLLSAQRRGKLPNAWDTAETYAENSMDAEGTSLSAR